MHVLVFLLSLVVTLSAFDELKAASFDCSNARSSEEKAICGNSKLSKLDEIMGRVFFELRDSSAQSKQILRDQRVWLKVRKSECGFENRNSPKATPRQIACLTKLTRNRISELGSLLSTDDHQAAVDNGKLEDSRIDNLTSSGLDPDEEGDNTVASSESKGEPGTTSPERLNPSDSGIIVAQQLMSDAAEFLRANPNTINLVELAKSISELKTAIESSGRTKVETATARLGNVLSGTDKYGQFAEEKRKVRQAKLIEELGTKVMEARQNSTKMRWYIARNATAEASAHFAGLFEQMELALKSPELRSLRDLNAEFSEVVSRYRLQDEIKEASRQASSGQTRNSEPESQQTQREIAKTEKNSFLLDGDLGDVVLLYNSSSEAPNVIRNLRGDIIFENDRAKLCWYSSVNDDSKQNQVIRKTIEELGVLRPDAYSNVCSKVDLSIYDIVIIKRANFLNSDKADAIQLLGLIEGGKLSKLGELSEAKFRKTFDQRDKLAADIGHAIRQGTKAGYGLLITDGTFSNVCLVVEDQRPGHERLLREMSKDLTEAMGGSDKPALVFKGLDEAFVSVKRQECRAIYATAVDLQTIIKALERDSITFKIHPIWFDMTEVAASQSKAVGERADAARRDEAERIRLKDEQNLARLRAERDAKDKNLQQKELREKFQSRAQARGESLLAIFKDHFASKASTAPDLFTQITRWHQKKINDFWELEDIDFKISDYGTVQWKGRSLEAAIIKLTVNMKNAPLGERSQDCFEAGLIFDDEFSFLREPFESNCKVAEKALQTWKESHIFESSWNIR